MPATPIWSRRRIALFLGLAYLGSFATFLPKLIYPTLWFDDFTYLRQSWTWPRTLQHLWIPFNDHPMPLARLSTYLLVQIAGQASWLPLVLGFQGPLAVWLGMAIIYPLVRREFDSPALGVIATALFGISTQYFESVWWYSATFSLLALDFLMLGVLAAQRYRQTGRALPLFGSGAAAALACGWTGVGFTAGPLCSLYMLWAPDYPWRKRLFAAAIPSLGTAAFLAICLPLSGKAMLNAEHYRGKTAIEAFRPVEGIVNGGRAVVDNLLLGSFGLITRPCPNGLVVALLILAFAGGAFWWRIAPGRRFLLVGVAAIGGSYFLIYGARAGWPYESLCTWTRYQVFSTLGFVLFLVGGLARWKDWLTGHPLAVAIIVLVQFAVQVPRAFLLLPRYDEQIEQLHKVDDVDALCRADRINAADAIRALPHETALGGLEEDNVWDLLRGSADPQPHEVDDVRRVLMPDAQKGDKEPRTK